MHEREEGWGLTDDGSGVGDGGSGGEGGRGVSGDGEGGRGISGDGEEGGVDGGSGGVDDAARLRGVGGGSGVVDGAWLWWRRRRRRSGATVNRGDGGARGGLRDLGENWPGGNSFLVKSNLAVARLGKRAIAKIAIAVSAKRAAAIAM